MVRTVSKERLGPNVIKAVKKGILIRIDRTKALASMLNPNNQKFVNFNVAHQKAKTLRKFALFSEKRKVQMILMNTTPLDLAYEHIINILDSLDVREHSYKSIKFIATKEILCYLPEQRLWIRVEFCPGMIV